MFSTTGQPAVKEPVGLMRQDGKRPDGTTILPWSRGRPLAWDVTVPDTYADAHVVNTAREAGACSSQPCSDQQEHQVQPAIQHSCVRSGGHWDRGYMAPSGGGTGTGDWKTDVQHYRRCHAGSPTFCSISCPWHYGGGLLSHFKTLSPS